MLYAFDLVQRCGGACTVRILCPVYFVQPAKRPLPSNSTGYAVSHADPMADFEAKIHQIRKERKGVVTKKMGTKGTYF